MAAFTRRGLIAVALASGVFGAFSALAQGYDEAAAKGEGKVTWYTSTPISIAQETAALFEKKTGIKVDLFRSGGSQIMRRFQQELSAKRFAADVITASDLGGIGELAKDGAFVAFKPEHFDQVPENGKDPDGLYVAQRLNMITIYYRSDKVKAEDAPKTLAELTDPKYKGQLVMADPSFSANQLSVTGTMAEKLGWEYFEKLAANDVMIVQGAQQTVDMVKRGERLIAVAASNSYAAEAKLAGFAIETVYPEDGTFLIPSPSAVVSGGPNPNAAKALATFLLSDEAQALFPKTGGYAARSDIAPPEGSPPLDQIKITPIDEAYIAKEGNDIKRRFTRIFN